MTAHDNFFSSLSELTSAYSEPLLISKAPSEKIHNAKAKIFRKGLCIISFSILEDFIKNRLGEIFENIHASHLAFASLPEKIQRASTIGAARALLFRIPIVKDSGDDWLKFIQDHSKMIASTKNASYKLSYMSMGWNKPNLSDDDIPSFLKSFNVKKPWENIDKIGARVGNAIPSSKDAFRNAMRRRHSSAHDSKYNVGYSEISNFGRESIVIALGFDLLLTTAQKFLKINAKGNLNKKISANDISLVFINEINKQKWHEIKENNKRAYKIYNSKEDAIRGAKLRRKKNDYFIIVKNRLGLPIEWL